MKRLSHLNLALNIAVYHIHHWFENILQASSKPLYCLTYQE